LCEAIGQHPMGAQVQLVDQPGGLVLESGQHPGSIMGNWLGTPTLPCIVGETNDTMEAGHDQLRT